MSMPYAPGLLRFSLPSCQKESALPRIEWHFFTPPFVLVLLKHPFSIFVLTLYRLAPIVGTRPRLLYQSREAVSG